MAQFEFTQPPQGETATERHPWVAVPLRSRVFAAGLDGLLALLAGGVATLIVALLTGVRTGPDGAGLLWAMTFGMPIGALVYLGLLEGRRGRHNGQTVGKRALHIRTVMNDGRPLTRTAAWQRAGLLALPMATAGFPSGDLAALADLRGPAFTAIELLPELCMLLLIVGALTNPFRRAPHDHATSTTVVFAKRLDEPAVDTGPEAHPDQTAIDRPSPDARLDGLVVDGSPVIALPPRPDSRFMAAFAVGAGLFALFGPTPF